MDLLPVGKKVAVDRVPDCCADLLNNQTSEGSGVLLVLLLQESMKSKLRQPILFPFLLQNSFLVFGQLRPFCSDPLPDGLHSSVQLIEVQPTARFSRHTVVNGVADEEPMIQLPELVSGWLQRQIQRIGLYSASLCDTSSLIRSINSTDKEYHISSEKS